MIINSASVEVIRRNSARLAQLIRTKEDLLDFATAASLDQIFLALENLLTNTEMYFDDELISLLTAESWSTFKAVLMVYTLNTLNKNKNQAHASVNVNSAVTLSRDYPLSTIPAH